MKYEIQLLTNNGRAEYRDGYFSLIAEKNHTDTRSSMSVKFIDWEEDTFVFMPACVYDGNAFEKMKSKYPLSFSIIVKYEKTDSRDLSVPLNPLRFSKIKEERIS